LVCSHSYGKIAPLTPPDFNDPANLDLYFQIRSFKNDLSTGELLLERRSRTEQLKIHTIAQSFDLEYEYSVGTRVVRISRTVSHEAQIFAPEATIDNIHENLPHWEHLHGSFGQDFSDFSNFDSGIASRGADGETPEAHAIPNNQDSLADMALPPFDLSQSMNFLSQPVPSMLAASTQSNLAQEIDELLSNAHSVRQEQQEPLFEDPAINSAIIDEFEHPSEKKKSQRVPSPSSPYQWGDIRRPAAAGRSGSAHSDASGISGVSGRSGRTGPLSDLARAGMKAVKKVGACWRCVFLRKKVGKHSLMHGFSATLANKKKCDPEDPCLICPKGGKSSWEALGCHRGDFKTRMLPIRICPVESSDPVQVIAEDNSYWLDNQVRVSWVENDDRVEVTDDETLHKEEVRRLFLEEIKDKWELLCKPPDQAVLQSLQSYTMDVVWELLETPSSLSLLSEEGTFDSLLRILPTAAVYQANVENVRRHQKRYDSLLTLQT
jgi:hypothetical protein